MEVLKGNKHSDENIHQKFSKQNSDSKYIPDEHKATSSNEFTLRDAVKPFPCPVCSSLVYKSPD